MHYGYFRPAPTLKQFVKERQEIKSLQTCESHFFIFPTKICGVSVIRFALQKTVQVDTRFYPDTDDWLPVRYCIIFKVTYTYVTSTRHCNRIISIHCLFLQNMLCGFRHTIVTFFVPRFKTITGLDLFLLPRVLFGTQSLII